MLLFLYITIACSCVQWPVGSCTTYLKVPPSPHKGKGADKHCDQYKEDGPSCDVGGRTHPSNSCLGREQNIHWRQVALWHRMLYVNYRNRFPRYNFRSSLYMFLYYMGCGWLLQMWLNIWLVYHSYDNKLINQFQVIQDKEF